MFKFNRCKSELLQQLAKHMILTGACLTSGLTAANLPSPEPHNLHEELAKAEQYYENWYQVEVVIFANLSADNSTDPESWPKDLTLAYPAELKHLIDPLEYESVQTQKAEIEAEIAAQEAWLEQQRSLLTEPSLDPLEETTTTTEEDATFLQEHERTESESNVLAPELDGELSSDSESETTEFEPLADELINEENLSLNSPPKVTLPELEKPFFLLDSSQLSLMSEVKKMKRSQQYKTLFHGGWRQPIRAQEDAQNIVIFGGDRFNENNELEGTITLHLSRYLHLNTDLWLTTFEPNFGQPEQHWPTLPEQPINPELILPERPSATLIPESTISESTQSELSLSWPIPTESNPPSPLFKMDGAALGLEPKGLDEIAGTDYLIQRIITLTTKRRMRSKELHYIDHPKMGILIRIDKYTPSYLEEMKN